MPLCLQWHEEPALTIRTSFTLSVPGCVPQGAQDLILLCHRSLLRRLQLVIGFPSVFLID